MREYAVGWYECSIDQSAAERQDDKGECNEDEAKGSMVVAKRDK